MNNATTFSRRAFLNTSVMAVGASYAFTPSAQAAAEPARPSASAAKSEMKVGLYSITYLGIWYRGAALSLEGVIQRARKFGYDGVELDGKA
jgi:hypothetical protein